MKRPAKFFFFFFVPHCDFQIGPDQAKTWRPPGPGGVSQWFIDGDVKSGLSLRPGRWPCPCSRLHRNLPDYHLIPPSCDRSQKREEVWQGMLLGFNALHCILHFIKKSWSNMWFKHPWWPRRRIASGFWWRGVWDSENKQQEIYLSLAGKAVGWGSRQLSQNRWTLSHDSQVQGSWPNSDWV